MKSIASRFVPFAAVAVTLFSLSGSARADVLPPNACATVDDVGQSCENAGDNHDEPGTCVSSTCHSASPPDGGSDYPCAICEVSDAGPSVDDAGNGSDAGPTTTRPDAGTTSAPSSSSGCSATPDTRDGATGFAMLVLGMIGLGLSRRKRA